MNKKLKNLLLLLGLLLFLRESYSQDIQFSQFYAVPLYQNPAFAGSAHTTRATLHQRLQWPGLDSKYVTNLFSVDHYFNNYKSGVGLLVMKDGQGGSKIGSTQISLSYSYEVRLSSALIFRPGLSASFVSRDINYNHLRFPSQFNDTVGYISGSSSPFGSGGQRKTYPDIGAGGILYNDKMWFGFSTDHLNVPNQSFTQQVSRLPMKVSFTGGYKFILQKKRSSAYMDNRKDVNITPTFHYKFQGKSDQLDIGLYGMYDKMMIGFWYRGIPIKQYKVDVQNNESFIVLMGWKVKSMSISYSYDFVISKLAASRTGGAHELNLTYFYHKPHKKHKPMKRLPCPQFYNH